VCKCWPGLPNSIFGSTNDSFQGQIFRSVKRDCLPSCQGQFLKKLNQISLTQKKLVGEGGKCRAKCNKRIIHSLDKYVLITTLSLVGNTHIYIVLCSRNLATSRGDKTHNFFLKYVCLKGSRSSEEEKN
jgi:hypothetical protein